LLLGRKPLISYHLWFVHKNLIHHGLSSNICTYLVHVAHSHGTFARTSIPEGPSLDQTMVIIAGKSSVAASRLLWKQQGKPLLALISSTNFVPTPSSSRQQQGFHSYTSPFQFQATSTSKEQRRCLSSGKRDFYQVLGVPKGSDKATIKKAYFKLAKEHHPDTNQVRLSFIAGSDNSMSNGASLTL
jgi:hypothetical protein